MRARVAPRGAVSVHLHSEPVVLCFKVRGDVERGGCEAVLGVADKFGVEPHIERGLHTLKADEGLLAEQFLVDIEELTVDDVLSVLSAL